MSGLAGVIDPKQITNSLKTEILSGQEGQSGALAQNLQRWKAKQIKSLPTIKQCIFVLKKT